MWEEQLLAAKQFVIEKLAWAAGIIDSDGTICVTTGSQAKSRGGAPSHRLVVEVSNTRTRVIRRLERLFGGVTHWDERDKNRRGRWIWRVTREEAQTCLLYVLPYLQGRHEDALHGVLFRTNRAEWPRGKKLTEQEIARRNAGQAVIRSNDVLAVSDEEKALVTGTIARFDKLSRAAEPVPLYVYGGTLLRAYIAGLFDGDGSVFLTETDRADRPNPTFTTAPFLCIGSREFGDTIASITGGRSPRRAKDAESTWMVAYSAKSVKKLFPNLLPYAVKAGEMEILVEFLKRQEGRHRGSTPLAESQVSWARAASRAIRILREELPLSSALREQLASDADSFSEKFEHADKASRLFEGEQPKEHVA